MKKQPLFVGGETSTKQIVASILGQSEKACVYTTRDNHLRWEYYHKKGELSKKLKLVVKQFDTEMSSIKKLSCPFSDKLSIYELLGKRLFIALDADEALTNKTFQDIDVLVKFYAEKQKSFRMLEGQQYDVGVICALNDPELKAVRNLSVWNELEVHANDPQVYFQSEWVTQAKTTVRLIAAAPNTMGLVSSAALAVKMILRFKPKLMCIVGIAAGSKAKSQGYGDILAPNQTFDMGSSKTTEKKGQLKVLPSAEPLAVSPRILSRLNKRKADRTSLDSIKNTFGSTTPATSLQVHVGPLFSSSTVLDAQQPVADILGMTRKLVGIEMEAYAVHRACHDTISPPVDFVCFKSICDFAKGKSDDWQQYAAFTAAKYMQDFIVTEWEAISNSK